MALRSLFYCPCFVLGTGARGPGLQGPLCEGSQSCPQPFQRDPMDTLQDTAGPRSPQGHHGKTRLNTGQNTAQQRRMEGWKGSETTPEAPQADEEEEGELLPAPERDSSAGRVKEACPFGSLLHLLPSSQFSEKASGYFTHHTLHVHT